jgi:hypothetical protein
VDVPSLVALTLAPLALIMLDRRGRTRPTRSSTRSSCARAPRPDRDVLLTAIPSSSSCAEVTGCPRTSTSTTSTSRTRDDRDPMPIYDEDPPAGREPRHDLRVLERNGHLGAFEFPVLSYDGSRSLIRRSLAVARFRSTVGPDLRAVSEPRPQHREEAGNTLTSAGARQPAPVHDRSTDTA